MSHVKCVRSSGLGSESEIPLFLLIRVSLPEMPMLASSDSSRTIGSRVTVSVFDAVSGDAFVWVAPAACYPLALENDMRGYQPSSGNSHRN